MIHSCSSSFAKTKMMRKDHEKIVFILSSCFFHLRKRGEKENGGMIVFCYFPFPFSFQKGEGGRGKRKEQEFSLLPSWLTVAISFDFILYSPFLREVGRKVMVGNNIVIRSNFVVKTVIFCAQFTIFFSKKIKF